MTVKLTDAEALDLRELLSSLSNKIDEFIPNVKGGSDETIMEAQALSLEARVRSENLQTHLTGGPTENSYSFSKAEMIGNAIEFARIVGRDRPWDSYAKELGLLIDFVDQYFPR